MSISLDLSIVIVSFNTKNILANCISSIRRHTKGISYEIVVVDNASQDSSVDWIRRQGSEFNNLTGILNKQNKGFAKANNQGIKMAQGRYILLLNSDTKLKEDSLSKMINFMEKEKEAGISSCMLLNPDESIQATGGYFPSLMRLFLWSTFLDDLPFIADIFGSYHPHTPKFLTRSSFYKKAHKQDWVTGAFFLIRKEAVGDIGPLDEKFFMYVEEIDYCFRAKKKGWEVWYVPDTAIIHIGGASSKGDLIKFTEGGVGKEQSIIGEFEGLKRFYKKHYPTWQYPLLASLLKLAALLRFILYGFLKGESGAKRIYAKAFGIT